MGADAFAPWHIILLVIVLVLLFGARRLPGAAKSLGESMHIFKKSVSGLHQDNGPADNAASGFSDAQTPAQAQPFQAPPAALIPPDPTAAQLQDLQRQVADDAGRARVPNLPQPSQPI